MEDYLYHHGIKGQRWGVRRFQREDGTRTPRGKAREREGGALNPAGPTNSKTRAGLSDKQKQNLKTAAKITAGVAAAALTAYGAYKLDGAVKNAAYNKSIETGNSIIRQANMNVGLAEFIQSSATEHSSRYSSNFDHQSLKDDYKNLAETKRDLKERNERTARENSKNLGSAIKTLRGRSDYSYVAVGTKNLKDAAKKAQKSALDSITKSGHFYSLRYTDGDQNFSIEKKKRSNDKDYSYHK